MVKIAPCYFCFGDTTTLTVLGKVIQLSLESLEAQKYCISEKCTIQI